MAEYLLPIEILIEQFRKLPGVGRKTAARYALSLLECKGCVGFDWFKYWDNDPDDSSADLSNINSNKGIIDNDGNEYAVLVEYMEELNNQKYSLIKFFSER